MAEFELRIKASLPARNLSSASAKTEVLRAFMERKGWGCCELHLVGHELSETSTKERT